MSSWRQKLHMRSDRGLQDVLAERVALGIRDELLELARADDPKEKTNSREAFWNNLLNHRADLGHARCDAALEKGAKHSLDPVRYWEEPMPDCCSTTRRVFGLLWHNDKLQCSAVQRHEAGAARWDDYTGRPGLVEQDVWKWRLWACARGGFEALRPSERSDMELAEGKADPDFLRVERSHDLFEYARDLKPQGRVPSLHIWRGLLFLVANDASRVVLVRRKADEERLCWGISWNGVRYAVDAGLALAQAHRAGLLKPSDVQVFLECEAHASRNAGAYPREIILEAGENDRYDHVRQREDVLAREAKKIAVGVASMRLVSWRCRTEHDWLALAEHSCTPSMIGISLVSYPHVRDGFGKSSSSAVAVDLPDDDYTHEEHASLDIGCKQEDLDEEHVDLSRRSKRMRIHECDAANRSETV